LHGLVKLGEFDFLDERDSLFNAVGLGFDLLGGGRILLACFAAHNKIGPNGRERTRPPQPPKVVSLIITKPGLLAQPRSVELEDFLNTTLSGLPGGARRTAQPDRCRLEPT